jgi:hypothetical protein
VRLVPEYQVIPTAQQPHRYVLVLDASGSMSANFAGQCNNAGLVQCANGPPGFPAISVTGTGPTYYWATQAERRIYVAKQALLRLVSLTNMPGNASYTTTRPPDQVGVVWFNDTVPAGNTQLFSSTPAAITSFILNANKTNNDAYRSSGGTNGAAGLYRASLMLAAAPPTVVDANGQTYSYQNNVILVTDGVSNQFLDTNAANLSGGISSSGTYPAGSYCRNLGSLVTESASCQTTDIGGVYNGWDRPISQMSAVSANSLRNSTLRASVFVIALSSIPSTGLMDGVASSPGYFFSAESLTTLVNGTTNVDGIIDVINSKVLGSCVPGPNGTSTDVILPDQFVNGTGGLTYPTVGEVVIHSSTNTFTTPIIAGQGGTLSYAFTDVPQGTYVLEAYLYYHHPLDPPDVMRQYSKILSAEQAVSSFTIDVPANQQLHQLLTLKLNGDVCAAP